MDEGTLPGGLMEPWTGSRPGERSCCQTPWASPWLSVKEGHGSVLRLFHHSQTESKGLGVLWRQWPQPQWSDPWLLKLARGSWNGSFCQGKESKLVKEAEIVLEAASSKGYGVFCPLELRQVRGRGQVYAYLSPHSSLPVCCTIP